MAFGMADILRDRGLADLATQVVGPPPPPPAGPPPGLPPDVVPPPPGPSLPPFTPAEQVAQGGAQMGVGFEQRRAALDEAQRQFDAIKAQREAEATRYEGVTAPLYAVTRQQLDQPPPPLPEAPEETAPPSRAIRPFMTGTPGEDPMQSVQRTVAGLSVLAQMGAGILGGYPRGALAAMTGALKGWEAGDEKRGNRHFADWQAETAQMNRTYERQRQRYQDIIEANKGSVDALRTQLLLAAAEHGDRDAALAASRGDLDTFFQLEDRKGQLVQEQGKLALDLGTSRSLAEEQARAEATRLQQWMADYELKLGEHRRKLAADEQVAGPKLSDVSTLRQQFLGQSKDFVTVRDAYARLQEAAKSPSAAGDLAVIFNYMKLLDPGSVVRETEFANAQNAAGVPERIRAQYNRILSGERLTEETRRDFIAQSAGQFAAQRSGQLQLEREFRAIAERSGMDPDQVAVDFLGAERVPGPAPAASPPAPAPGGVGGARISVIGPNGETGSVPVGTALPQGWKAR